VQICTIRLIGVARLTAPMKLFAGVSSRFRMEFINMCVRFS
jgi:hypothetical protein